MNDPVHSVQLTADVISLSLSLSLSFLSFPAPWKKRIKELQQKRTAAEGSRRAKTAEKRHAQVASKRERKRKGLKSKKKKSSKDEDKDHGLAIGVTQRVLHLFLLWFFVFRVDDRGGRQPTTMVPWYLYLWYLMHQVGDCRCWTSLGFFFHQSVRNYIRHVTKMRCLDAWTTDVYVPLQEVGVM